jgi:IclR family pca regulon transcriptional regulator
VETSRNFIESLSRGLSLLSVLSENSSPLTLTELSDRLGLSKSTIQRLTYTLQHLGYLDRDRETKKYHLGPKFLALGFSVMKGLDLRKVALPFLLETSKEIGETVNLAVLDGNEIVYVERIKTQQILNINLHVGSRLPAFCTSMGKAMLAFLPKDRLREILARMELTPLTAYTITKKQHLEKELRRVRARGFATNNEELSVGLRSTAAPVRNFNGEVIAAVNIAVPSIRVSPKRLETVFAKKVMATADKISSVLGYKAEVSGKVRGEYKGGGILRRGDIKENWPKEPVRGSGLRQHR